MLNTTVKVSLKQFLVEEIKIDPINFNFVQNERKIREMEILHRMNPLAADKKEEANNNNNNIQLGGWRGGGGEEGECDGGVCWFYSVTSAASIRRRLLFASAHKIKSKKRGGHAPRFHLIRFLKVNTFRPASRLDPVVHFGRELGRSRDGLYANERRKTFNLILI